MPQEKLLKKIELIKISGKMIAIIKYLKDGHVEGVKNESVVL